MTRVQVTVKWTRAGKKDAPLPSAHADRTPQTRMVVIFYFLGGGRIRRSDCVPDGMVGSSRINAPLNPAVPAAARTPSASVPVLPSVI